MIDVFQCLHRAKEKSKLLFVGDGELLTDAKSKVDKYGLRKDVIFTEARSDVEDLYCAMDYYIFPSTWEGFGISLIGAQASGLPCLCSENIQEEAIVTDLAEQMDLGSRAYNWSRKIISMMDCYQRKDRVLDIKKAEFDIRCSTLKMQDFYLRISSRGKISDNLCVRTYEVAA